MTTVLFLGAMSAHAQVNQGTLTLKYSVNYNSTEAYEICMAEGDSCQFAINVCKAHRDNRVNKMESKGYTVIDSKITTNTTAMFYCDISIYYIW